ncbi:MAG: hypothetical protein ACLRJV_20645 [Eubacteriales bacterium]
MRTSICYKTKDALDIDGLSLPQAGVAVIGHNEPGKSTFVPLWFGHCRGIVKVDGKRIIENKDCLCYMVMQDVNHQLFTTQRKKCLSA